MAALVRASARSLKSTPIMTSSSLPLIQRRGVAFKLFVGGLSYYTTETELSEAFSRYGQVIEAKVVTDRVLDKSKGFGFVTYASVDEAHNAVAEMNGKALNGRVIYVDYAKPKCSYGGGMPIARGPPEPRAGPSEPVDLI